MSAPDTSTAGPAPAEPVAVRKPGLVTPPRLVFSLVFLGLGLAVAAMSLKGEPQRRLKVTLGGTTPVVTPVELATWGLEGRRDYVVIDLRPHEDFEKEHIRGAVSCGTCHDSAAEGRRAQQGDTFVDLTKKLVLYTQEGGESITLPKALAQNRRVSVLAGGYEAWKAQVMAPVAFGGEADEAELAAKKQREAMRAFQAGERAPSSVANLPLTPIRRESPHAPAKPTEGC